jgi:hypothetical protein
VLFRSPALSSVSYPGSFQCIVITGFVVKYLQCNRTEKNFKKQGFSFFQRRNLNNEEMNDFPEKNRKRDLYQNT